MTCADCDNEARWVFNDPGALPIAYCDQCLPQWLRSRAVEGSLGQVPEPEPEPEVVTAVTSRAKK